MNINAKEGINMAEMTQEVMGLINGDDYSYLATASKDGKVNVAIIGSARAVSPDTIAMAAGFMNKSYQNLQENPKATIIVYSSLPPLKTKATMEDFSKIGGAQIKGSVTLLTSGEVHENMKKMIAERISQAMADMMKATVILKVEEVYTVGLGPEAGKRIS
jgi:predicted pyridoxine 5'-phosphate oxidase superfamily flavin-nucleotide-binding protein